MNKKKRLTLDQLIAAKEQHDRDAMRVEEFEVPSLGGTLLFKRPSDEMILDMIDNIKDEQDTKTLVDEFARVLYNCCDQLKEKELYEQLEVGNPVDVVFEVFTLGDILDLGDKVCSMNPLFNEAEETVKNG